MTLAEVFFSFLFFFFLDEYEHIFVDHFSIHLQHKLRHEEGSIIGTQNLDHQCQGVPDPACQATASDDVGLKINIKGPTSKK